MDVVDKFYSGYGEGAPRGKGPNQGLIQAKGNEYLEKDFPRPSPIPPRARLYLPLNPSAQAPGQPPEPARRDSGSSTFLTA